MLHCSYQGTPLLWFLVLIIFHKLIKTEKNSKPTSTIVRLEIKSNFLHNCSPATWIIILDNVVNTSSKLYSDELRRVDNGFYNVLTDTVSVFFWDGVRWDLSWSTFTVWPILGYHIFQVDNPCETRVANQLTAIQSTKQTHVLQVNIFWNKIKPKLQKHWSFLRRRIKIHKPCKLLTQ